MIAIHHKEDYKPRVLVVDDDPMYDGLVVDHLAEDNQYHVLSARSGDQALKILEQTDVDVLITDIKMPNKDGFELINQVRTDHPTLSVIVISGFGRPRWLDRETPPGCVQFVEKPINFARLKKILREAVHDPVPMPRYPGTAEEKADATMFAGHAAQFPVLDMIQICCIAERTGCVTLRRDGTKGQIFLEQGEIVHAEVGSLTSANAFYELVSWNDANFLFENAVPPPRKSILRSWESLVYEGIQRRAARFAA